MSATDAEHWNAHALTVGARAAAWSEPEDRTAECIENLIYSSTPIKDGGLYLDLGAGWGRILVPLQRDHPQAMMVGIDVSQIMISGRPGSGPFPPILEVGGDGTLPWTDCLFDGVYSMLMFQHITNDTMERYIDEVARVLDHDGWFRFQFVEGSVYADRDRRRSLGLVLTWLEAASLSVRAVTHNLMFDDWCWVTAVKV